MENISQFRYFLYKFIRFIIIVTIILYINRYISEKSHNIKSYQYNRTMLYLFFLYLGIFISDIMTYESDYVTRMVYYIIFCILSIYFLNWAIFKYMYYGFWYSFLISLGSTLLIGLIFMAAFIYGIYGQGEKIRDPVFLQFNYSEFVNSSITNFITYFFPIVGLVYWLTSSNSKLSNYLNQNLMGLFTTILFIFIAGIFAIKIKLLNPNQILNTVFTYYGVLYILFIVQTYFLIDSIHNSCYGLSSVENAKKDEAGAELLRNLLILSIILMLILNDIRKWSFFNYSSYLIITIFILLCLFSYSTKYPSVGLLSFYGFIEWCILSTYNTHDTGNSFHFVMMNQKYNLKNVNKEKEGTT